MSWFLKKMDRDENLSMSLFYQSCIFYHLWTLTWTENKFCMTKIISIKVMAAPSFKLSKRKGRPLPAIWKLSAGHRFPEVPSWSGWKQYTLSNLQRGDLRLRPGRFPSPSLTDNITNLRDCAVWKVTFNKLPPNTWREWLICLPSPSMLPARFFDW